MAVVIGRSGGWGSDTLNAAAALVQGLTAAKSEGENRQLQLLSLLARDEQNKLTPLAPNEATSSNFMDALFGAGGRTAQGQPVFNIAGSQFKMAPVGTFGILPEIPTTSTGPVTSGPVPSFKLPEWQGLSEIPQAQAPSAPVSTPAPQPGQSPMAVRMNNPLNVKYGALTKQYVDNGQATLGDPATDGGLFLKFVSPDAGLAAAQALLASPLYATRTVDQGLKLWSNQGYGGEIVAKQIDPSRKVGSLTPEERGVMIQAMAQREGWTGAPPGLRGPDTRFAGPGAVAPEAPPPAPGTMGEVAEPRLAQADQRIAQNPSAGYLDIPGVGRLTPEQYRTYRQRMSLYAGVPRTTAGREKYFAASEKIVGDIRTEERDLLARKKEAMTENPAYRDIIKAARTPEQLQQILEERIPPQGAVAQKAYNDLMLVAKRVPKNPDGTMTRQGLEQWDAAKQFYADKLAKPEETFKRAEDAANVPASRKAAEIDITGRQATEEELRKARLLAEQKAQEPTTSTDLPNRLAGALGLPSYAAASPEQKQMINDQIVEHEKRQRIDDALEKQQASLELVRNAHLVDYVPAEKQKQYVDRTTLRPFREPMTWEQLYAKKPIEVSVAELKEIEALDTMRPMIQEIKSLVADVYGPGGPLEGVAQNKGLGGRLQGLAAKKVVDLKQSDPRVRMLDERLREYGTRSIVALEGLKGRPAYELLRPALAVRPSLGEPGAFLGLGGRLPDTKETILGQVGATEKLLDRVQATIIGGKAGAVASPPANAATPTPQLGAGTPQQNPSMPQGATAPTPGATPQVSPNVEAFREWQKQQGMGPQTAPAPQAPPLQGTSPGWTVTPRSEGTLQGWTVTPR